MQIGGILLTERDGLIVTAKNQYMTGLWRNDAKGSDDGIYLIEHVKCCVAPYGMKDVPASCKTANWWRILDR